MPSHTPAPALPAAVTLLGCSECSEGTFTLGRDGRFHCSCGLYLLPREVEVNLDSDDVWCVTAAQEVAVVTSPVVAMRQYRAACDVMESPGSWGPMLEAAHVEFLDALGKLEAARWMGVAMADRMDVQIGRVYLACVINADGTLASSNAYALGWDCAVCAPRPLDPARQQMHPCRMPRAHAWLAVNGWSAFRKPRDGRTYDVLSPVAADLPAARERAAALLARRFRAAAE